MQQTQRSTQRLEQPRLRNRAGFVDVAGQVEQYGHGFGGAEIIVHGRLETAGVRVAPIDRIRRLCHRNGRKGRVEAFQRRSRVIQSGITEVEGAAVVHAEHEKAQRFAIVAFKHITDGEKIVERLAHFFAIHLQKAVVHPVARKGFSGSALALGNFVFVVRKLQVGPASVDVEGFSQQRHTHGRAFDVPAGTSAANDRIVFGIGRFRRLGGLPQHKIQWVLFAILHGHALAGTQVVE